MRSLVNTSRSIQPEGRVHVVTTDPHILRVLEITGIDSVLAVHASVEDAL